MKRLLLGTLVLALTAGAMAQPGAAHTRDESAAPMSKKTLAAGSLDKAKMVNRVRAEFLHAWNAYKKCAWGHDELKPLSKGARDWYGVSLYMTPLDSLDTMILMGLNEDADKTREYIV